MQPDITKKLAKCEEDLKRWQTRLKKATNKVTELDRLRRRLQAKMGPVSMFDLIGPPFSDKDVGADQQPVKTLADRPRSNAHLGVVTKREPDVMEAAVAVANDLDIPAFLARSDEPQLVDQLKAKRAKQVETDKKKMPLTGAAALEAAGVRRKKKA